MEKRAALKIDLVTQRLRNQNLIVPTFKSAPEIVRHFGAIQGQEYAQTKWSIGLRVPDLKDTDVEADLSAGKILRTHMLRPTWHFVAAQDIRWILTLTAPRVHQANAFMYRQLELDDRIFLKSRRLIEKHLAGNTHLTRDELNVFFKKHKIIADGNRLSYIMMHAELEGLICSGHRKGNQFTYALIDERVPATPKMNKEEAILALTRIYFTSRGPATLKDFSTWSGLTVTDCKKGILLLDKSLHSFIQDGETYYTSEIQPEKTKSQGFALLPIYDELVMGYKNRKAIMQYLTAFKPTPPLKFSNTLLYNGQIIGSWRRTIHGKRIELQYEVLKPLSRTDQRKLMKAIGRFEEFSDMPVTVNTGITRIP